MEMNGRLHELVKAKKKKNNNSTKLMQSCEPKRQEKQHSTEIIHHSTICTISCFHNFMSGVYLKFCLLEQN